MKGSPVYLYISIVACQSRSCEVGRTPRTGGLDKVRPPPYDTPTMNKIIAFFAALAVLVLLSAAPASDPDPGSAAQRGRVLVLDNEHTLTGDIEFADGEYRVRRLIGETQVPAARVLKLCASLEEAYQFL